jgi:precorrin-4 methylase
MADLRDDLREIARRQWTGTMYARLRSLDPDLYRRAIEQAGATSLALGLSLEHVAGIERAFVSFALSLREVPIMADSPYVVRISQNTTCPHCSRVPRFLASDNWSLGLPAFYLCGTCGFIGHIGVGPVRGSRFDDDPVTKKEADHG